MAANLDIAQGERADEFMEAYHEWRALGRNDRETRVTDVCDLWDIPNREDLVQTYHAAKRYRERTPSEETLYLRDNNTEFPGLDAFERLTGDWGVSSDWHIPLHSVRYLILYKAICRELGIRKHAIAGDLLNSASLSFHGHAPGDVFQTEINYAANALAWLLQDSDEVVWFLGNHDDLVMRRTEGQVTPQMLLKMLSHDPRVRISPYYHAEVNDTYRLTHAKAFSVRRGNVAYDLCAKFRKSVIMAHQHGVGIVPDATGRDVAIDLGGLFDPDKHAYIKMRDSKHPIWTPGFCVIRNNKPTVFSDSLKTDWDHFISAETRAWMIDQEKNMMRETP